MTATMVSYKYKILFFVFVIFFSLGCLIPGAVGNSLPTMTSTIEATEISPTTTPTITPLPTIDCYLENMSNRKIAEVNAYPCGLRIREVPDGKELGVIPDKSVVFILSDFTGDWTLIGWSSGGNLICGYSATRFLKIGE